MASLIRKTAVTLEMIKWEHSVFALPFALTATVLAANGLPRLSVLGWILVCMVSARSAAMAFNRLVDARIDAANPRTAMRAIPAGLLSAPFVGGFTVIMSAVFLFASWRLNRLTLELAPAALAVVLGYSYMKRITRWSHLVLGLALGIAPSAAWIAVRGTYDVRLLLMTAGVMLWVGGFDVLYACQDFEFDRASGLHSIPAAFGIEAAFWIARTMHLVMMVLLAVFLRSFHLHGVTWAGMAVVAALLIYEHAIISPKDMRRMNAAFFTMNGIIAAVFFVAVAADVLLHK